MNLPRPFRALGVFFALSACASLNLTGIEDMSATEDLRPPNAEPGACYGREISPATIETVTQHIQTRAASYAADGTLLRPARYRSEAVQRIVVPRQEIWFKVPCRRDMTENFMASVQRALQVRGIYRGRISGVYDTRTRRAIRKYQRPTGLDSAKLSLASARKLGLVAVARATK